MAGPLAGVRILDVAERTLSTKIAGMVLADLDAEVIHVEPPGGDPIRVLPGTSVWLRGQKSVVIGPNEAANGTWRSLRDSADVIIDSTQPWITKPQGLLDGWNPASGQILMVLTPTPQSIDEALKPRGASNPPVYGELVDARFGLSYSLRGYRDGPIFLGFPIAANGAAWMIMSGVLGALYQRERTGQGQVVTTSLLEGSLIVTRSIATRTDRFPEFTLPTAAQSNAARPPRRSVISMMLCADGRWVHVHTHARGSFDRLMQRFGREDLVDPKITVLGAPMEQKAYDEMWAQVEAMFKSQPASYWVQELAKVEVACMMYNPPGDALWEEQPIANGLVDVSPEGRRQLGRMAKFSRTPMHAGRHVPAAGEHDAELRLGRSAVRAKETHTNGAKPERLGPLDGVLVLDFGAFVAGPFGCRLLADLGARVIKIEEPAGDPYRGQDTLGLAAQRGKESLALDLKTDEGRAIVYDLVKRADVVYHNQRMGAITRLGIDHESLAKINPRLIYLHSSGYGNEGPWASLPAFEPLHSAFAGALNRTGGEGNKPQSNLSSMDNGCGLTGAALVIAALYERERSGKGQYIEMPQTGAGLFSMSDVYFEGERKVETFPLDQAQRGHAPTNALYLTKRGWLLIACFSEKEWDGVRRALRIPAGSWKDYASARMEMVGKSSVGAAIEKAMSETTALEAQNLLEKEGVPCIQPIQFPPTQLAQDEDLRDLGVIVMERQGEYGALIELGHPMRFSTSTKINSTPAPVIGQETIKILKEIGKTDAEVEALIEKRVVRAAGRAERQKVTTA